MAYAQRAHGAHERLSSRGWQIDKTHYDWVHHHARCAQQQKLTLICQGKDEMIHYTPCDSLYN